MTDSADYLPALIDSPWLAYLAQGFNIPMNGIEVAWVQWNSGMWIMLMWRAV